MTGLVILLILLVRINGKKNQPYCLYDLIVKGLEKYIGVNDDE